MQKTNVFFRIDVALFMVVILSLFAWQVKMAPVKSASNVYIGESVLVTPQVKTMVPAAPVAMTPVLPIMPPKVLSAVYPDYPSNTEAGNLILQALVNASGAVEQVKIKTGSGVETLDQSAITALYKWKFSPAMQGSASLASWYEVPVKFALK
ncbi:hypothetical protein A2276_00415 [candidate division WOR-1 bacterium RIFOXYA12_FULL_43_27]|uniref:TonB C-terminal domain-containing protein n=1 Tax=candidate division WOR-1 bacterium RIFOXYC2_FULL_46_14 TaxID=1802587 RepID=A0A1F4U4D0_UNCSA|nr:MAG: hypothetical protein A2276_00415 [candidate division WOR-1 bacterium RIFOXYA12_FULL_43_27]OGC20841.1 MAG: hypothetical protein A2292_07460 [candidate division WOR-1 bacterium RIFOXYB2_FULL_46_45]OGC31422.1 MAG: hypothetical protein A2232_03990 [candidate division WOR-1 bacterium RIFOXYA2_FULL_46_56]OGC39828.1 MAG: hypothetical protein A2438_04825 [candidate division WOR-1 bacterium RIFOXYC2_FULL_46_14]